eukprot:gene15292-biopygen9311
MTETLNLTVTDAIGIIEINNQPRRNAFDLAMWQNLPKLVKELDGTPAVRLIVLRGIGQSPFCSGADISEFSTVRATAAGGKAYEQANEDAFAALAHCAKPTLAAIRGFCMGGGVGLAASCDLRIAETGTEFGIPAARLGVGYPPRAMALIVAALGVQTAMDLFATARRFNADEALKLGFLARVFAADQFEDQLAKMARSIAANAPLSIKAAKAAIHHAARLPGASTAQHAEALAQACYDSADYVEGRSAFLEKRPPQFTGY